MKRAERTSAGVSVQIKGNGVSVKPELHDLVSSKMQRLSKYLDRLQTVDVELLHEKTRDSAHQNSVEVTAHVPGRTLRVRTTNADMQAAVDEAVDRLYRQLNRTKERMKAHHFTKPSEMVPLEQPEPEDTVPPNPVLHVERVDLEPQFEDEAIEELDLQQRPFYVFMNARDEQINVVYRRPDGSYGLIEPRVG
jgi:putative sigma-54 modulation protein